MAESMETLFYKEVTQIVDPDICITQRGNLKKSFTPTKTSSEAHVETAKQLLQAQEFDEFAIDVEINSLEMIVDKLQITKAKMAILTDHHSKLVPAEADKNIQYMQNIDDDFTKVKSVYHALTQKNESRRKEIQRLQLINERKENLTTDSNTMEDGDFLMKSFLLKQAVAQFDVTKEVQAFNGKNVEFLDWLLSWKIAEKKMDDLERTDIEKLMALKRVLRGEPLKMLDAFNSSTEHGYELAMKELNYFYNNDIIVIGKKLEALLSLNHQPCPKHIAKFEHYRVETKTIWNKFKTLDISAEKLLEIFFLGICNRGLPLHLRDKWSKTWEMHNLSKEIINVEEEMQSVQVSTDETPLVEKFFMLLDSEKLSMDRNSHLTDQQQKNSSNQQQQPKQSKQQSGQQKHGSQQNNGSQNTGTPLYMTINCDDKTKCPFCQKSLKGHEPDQCDKLEHWGKYQLKKACEKHELCENCLKPGHQAPVCKKSKHCTRQSCDPDSFKHHLKLHGLPKMFKSKN